ncbi:MAG: flagellar biosynthetic protein FliR [Planctomycetota bacterium]
MLEAFLLNQTALFTLVLGRVGGMIATAPLLSSQAAPVRVRALLAVSLAMLVTPLYTAPAFIGRIGVADFGRMIVGEVLIGLLLGLGVTILLSGVQLTGQIVAQMSGMALGDVFNPALDNNVSIFTQMFYFVSLAVFVAIGGHRMVLDAVIKTFEWAPPGEADLGASYAQAVIALASQSFQLGVRAAGPILIALFLSTVVLGLISRTLPQINTVVVGFGINSLLTLGVMMVSLGGVAWTFQEPLAATLELLIDAVKDGHAAEPSAGEP